MKEIIISMSRNELKEDIQDAVRREIQILMGSIPSFPSSTDGKKYLSRRETAKTLSISLPTLSKYVKKGFIRAHRIGSKVLFSKADVEASLKEIDAFKHCRKNPIL